MRKKVLAEKSVKQGLNQFQFVELIKGALLYIAFCHVVRTMIKAKLHLQLGFNCFTTTRLKQRGFLAVREGVLSGKKRIFSVLLVV